MTLDGSSLQGAKPYTLSNNCGAVRISGSTIVAKTSCIAFDSCKFGSYPIPTVTATNSAITGDIELTGGKLTATSGTLEGKIVTGNGYNESDLTITGGAFSSDPATYVANGYTATKIGNLWYVGVKKTVEVTTNDSNKDTDKKVDYVESGATAYVSTEKDSAIGDAAASAAPIKLDVSPSDCETVQLAKSTVQAIVNNKTSAADNAQAMTVTTKDASVTFDVKAVKALNTSAAAAEAITLTVTKEAAADTAVSEANKTAYNTVVTDTNKAKAVVVTLELKVDGTPAFTANSTDTNGTATVKIPLPAGCNTAKLYWLKDDGTTEEITCTISGGYAVATLNHFSEYVLIGDTVHTGSGSVPSGHTMTTNLSGITAVYVDGKKVDSKNYTVSGGNVTLTQAYLNTLSAGKHTFKAENATHIATGTFNVAKGAVSPQTADAGIAIYGMMSIMSLMGMGYIGKKKSR